MYNPCITCNRRFGKEYSEDCDKECEYASAVADLRAARRTLETLRDNLAKTASQIDNKLYPKKAEYKKPVIISVKKVKHNCAIIHCRVKIDDEPEDI